MGFGQILDVDVIANRRPVRRRIIGAVDVDMRALSKGSLQYERDEVCLRCVQLTDFAAGIGAGRVEVTQRHRAQAVSLPVRVKGPLNREFGLTIGVDWKLRSGLADRYAVWSAIG